MAEGKVFLAYMHPGLVNGRFHDSLLNLIDYDRCGSQHIVSRMGLETGPRVAAGRNDIVKRFLEQPAGVDWLLMLDSDMVFPRTLVDDLMASADPVERPVLGGLCFAGGRGRVYPTLYRFTETDGRPSMERCDSWPGGVCKVDATGAACLLIYRGVLALMADRVGGPAPWFADGTAIGMDCGEDIVFCMRCHHLDIPVHVDTRVELGHMKPDIFDATSYAEYEKLRDEGFGEDGMVHRFYQRAHLLDARSIDPVEVKRN